MYLVTVILLTIFSRARPLKITASVYNISLPYSKNAFITVEEWEDVENLFHVQPYNYIDIKYETDNLVESIQNVPSLEYIWIEDNALKSIPVLSNFPKLSAINLGRNRIRIVPNNTLANTPAKTIYLYRNEIEQIQPKSFGAEVEFLHLDCNKLASFYKDWFERPGRLKRLNFGGNLLEVIRQKEFGGFGSLQSLFLGFNRLKTIENQGLSFTKTFVHLRLNYNELEELLGDAFEGGVEIRDFFVNNNRLMSLSDGFERRVRVSGRLYPSANPWPCSYVGRFRNWTWPRRVQWRGDKCGSLGDVIEFKKSEFNCEKFCANLRKDRFVPCESIKLCVV